MDFTGIFVYNADNLFLASPELTQSLIVIGIGIVGFWVLHLLMLMIIGQYLLMSDTMTIRHRKKVLSNLILMKDIQTELEKEIEQATLKAAFQN